MSSQEYEDDDDLEYTYEEDAEEFEMEGMEEEQIEQMEQMEGFKSSEKIISPAKGYSDDIRYYYCCCCCCYYYFNCNYNCNDV